MLLKNGEKRRKNDGKGAEKGRKKGEKRPKSGTSGDPSPDQKKHFTPPQKHRKKSGTPTPKSTLQRTKSHPPPGGPPPCFPAKFPRNWAFFTFLAKFGEQKDEKRCLNKFE